MKISVVIAAYRGEKFIGEQLASIAGQILVPDEVVICDDSPDDLTEKEVRKFGDILNIRYFRNPSPLGVAANFNKALALASCDVVFLCDQDDLWYPEKTVKFMKYFSAGAQAVFCDSDITDVQGSPIGITHFQSRDMGFLRHHPAGKWEDQFPVSCRRFPAAGHDMALRITVLEKFLPLPDIPACHDNYLGVAAAAFDCWTVIPESLGIFRRHDASTSQAGKSFSLADKFREAVESIRNNSFAWNVRLFTEIYRRFPELPAERRELLLSRIAHSDARSRMASGFFNRLPLIWHEISSGNYSRFGRGWKNIVQDIFFR
ncbi:MAG: glycosyltransferase [Lentisphaerae bacterium]|nr:glycosyltransferase [Lentisphaerota bacterium]